MEMPLTFMEQNITTIYVATWLVNERNTVQHSFMFNNLHVLVDSVTLPWIFFG